MTEKKAILKVEGRDDLELPIHTPTLGRDVIDVSSLTANGICLLYTSPSPRDLSTSRMPSSA